jgi:hypothetical protein
MPIVEGVTAHSIIAVQGDGNPEDGADGIVMYKSAHIDGVASEKVVRSSHSTQDHPKTIREIKRILFEHASGVFGHRQRIVSDPTTEEPRGRDVAVIRDHRYRRYLRRTIDRFLLVAYALVSNEVAAKSIVSRSCLRFDDSKR